MKRHVLIALAAVFVVGLASSAQAGPGSCDFAQPKKAKKFQSDLVAAHLSCGNAGGLSINTATEDGVPACQPPTTFDTANGRPSGPLFAWLWDGDDEGKFATAGKIQFKSAKNKCTPSDEDANGDCVNLPDPLASADLKIQVKLNKVEDGTGALAGSGAQTPDGTLATLARATLKDRAGDDMTVIDFPAPFGLPMVDGKAKLKTTANTLLNAQTIGDLPDCSSIETVSIAIADPNGNTFATTGVFLNEIEGGD